MNTGMIIRMATIFLMVAASANSLLARGFGGFHGVPRPGGIRPAGVNVAAMRGMNVGGVRSGLRSGVNVAGMRGMNLGGMRSGINVGRSRLNLAGPRADGMNSRALGIVGSRDAYGGLQGVSGAGSRADGMNSRALRFGGSRDAYGGLQGVSGAGSRADGMNSRALGFSGARDAYGGLQGVSGAGSRADGMNSRALRFGGSRDAYGGLQGVSGAGSRADGMNSRALGFGGAAGGLDRPATRSGRNSLLGLPSDAGLHNVSQAVGGVALGPFGGTAVRSATVGPRGDMVAGRALGNTSVQLGGLRTISAASLRTRGTAVRRGFYGRDLYSRAWYARYPRAWTVPTWDVAYAYRAASWDSLGGWFDYDNVQPVYYDYGNNVTYQETSVYVNGQSVGTSDEYYQQAQQLVTAGAKAAASTEEQWMPLGVFAVSKAGDESTNMDFQLAVNKAGVVRGNYTNTVSNQVHPIKGSVDKKTQRVAWSIEGNTDTVIETGLYNLTKDEAPALVQVGKGRIEQWVLVRIKKAASDVTAD